MNRDFIQVLSVCVNQEVLRNNVEINRDINLFIASVNLKLYIADFVDVTFENKTLDKLLNAANDSNYDVVYEIAQKLISYDRKTYFGEFTNWLSNILQHWNQSCLLNFVQLYVQLSEQYNYGLDAKLSNLIDDYIMCMITEESDICKCILFYKLLPMYMRLRPCKDLVERMFQHLVQSEDLSLLIHILDINAHDWLSTISSSSEFWLLIQKYVTGSNGFGVKAALQLLRRSVGLIATSKEPIDSIDGTVAFNPNEKEEFLGRFDDFIVLVEVLQEKQLHLILPACSKLDTIQQLHRSWLLCIYNLLLKHMQTSINFFAVNDVFKRRWLLEDDVDFKAVFHGILLALNNGEYNKASRETFANLQNFAVGLDGKFFAILAELITDIQWTPVSLYCTFDALFKQTKVVSLSETIKVKLIKQIKMLPHKSIRTSCAMILIDFLCFNHEVNGIAYDEYKQLFKHMKEIKFIMTEDVSHIYCGHDIESNLYIPECNWNYVLKRFVQKSRTIIDELMPEIVEDALENANELSIDLLQTIAHYKLGNVTNDLSQRITKLEPKSISTDKLYTTIQVSTKTIEEYVFERINSLGDNEDLNYIKYLIMKNSEVITNDSKLFNEIDDFLLSKNNFNAKQIELCAFIANNFNRHSAICRTSELQINRRTFGIYFEYLKQGLNVDVLNGAFEFIDTNVDEVQNVILLNCIIDCSLTCAAPMNVLQRCLELILNFKEIDGTALLLERLLKTVEMNESIKIHFHTQIVDACINVFKTYKRLIKMKIERGSLSYLIEVILYEEDVRKHEKADYEVSAKCRDYDNNFLTERESIIKYAVKQVLELCNLNGNRQLIDDLARSLTTRYRTNFNKRYFPDSQLFYEKIRILQVLLLVHEQCSCDVRNELRTLLTNSLLMESHQNCVRHMIQWLLIRLYRHDVNAMFDAFTEALNGSEKIRTPTLIALMPIMYQLIEAKEELYEDFLLLIMPLTMGANFKMRLHSQFMIAKLYCSAIERESSTFKRRYGNIFVIVEKVLQATDERTKRDELKKIDFFLQFQPERFYSLDVIFVSLPKYYNALQTELIIDEDLKNDCISIHSHHELSIKNDRLLSMATGNDVEIASYLTDPTLTTAYIQKKIVPAKQEEQATRKSGLLLVASLIESAANLGGLTRTSEIYGVDKFVMNDAKVVLTKEYKSLSLSSEKWVDIVEIKERDLIDYLLDLKAQNYVLVGLEQTTNSHRLNGFKFDTKTALLLGNERSGIPASFLPLLDVTLEIPQFGMVRSLNVHVAGAICIWEYSKQHFYK